MNNAVRNISIVLVLLLSALCVQASEKILVDWNESEIDNGVIGLPAIAAEQNESDGVIGLTVKNETDDEQVGSKVQSVSNESISVEPKEIESIGLNQTQQEQCQQQNLSLAFVFLTVNINETVNYNNETQAVLENVEKTAPQQVAVPQSENATLEVATPAPQQMQEMMLVVAWPQWPIVLGRGPRHDVAVLNRYPLR